MTTLTRLDLGHNEIIELPPGIGKLVRLEELWLNNNPLATLPADIQSCIMLKSLYLAVSRDRGPHAKRTDALLARDCHCSRLSYRLPSPPSHPTGHGDHVAAS